ncbi:hypothetical protein [Bacillus litorisediminis]|uniref:hypothetical protein n=1 Tax=Bacillus litorisediminis TaxID=2922713 RepID=UPI001FAB4CCC|nr:hypothetical protein [Bacillus litorisediminis]
MNDFRDSQWKLLQQIKPTADQNEKLRSRIWNTLQEHPEKIKGKRMLHVKPLLAASVFILLCGAFLMMFLQNSTQPFTQGERNFSEFNWELKEVYAEESENGLTLYREGQSAPLGTVREITQEQMNEIVSGYAMYVEEILENFPYPTKMYIEHVKREDVGIRYHFFITPTEDAIIHFTFDYPKLEYAEIFQAVGTLQFNGIEPYRHNEPLYVTHGYGKMIYPVGLEPISISSNQTEIYYWEEATQAAFEDYLDKISTLSGWEKESEEGFITFNYGNGQEIISIHLNGKEITYQYSYPNRE